MFILVTGSLLAWLLYRLLQRLRQEERQAAFSTSLQTTLIQAMPDMLWMKDSDGRYIEINEPAARLFGLAPAQILGRSDHDLLPPAVADSLRAQTRSDHRRCPVQQRGMADFPRRTPGADARHQDPHLRA